MTTIIINQDSDISVTLKVDGNPVVIAYGSIVTAQLFDLVSKDALFTPAITLSHLDIGSDWDNGIVAIALDAVHTESALVTGAMLVINVDGKIYRFKVSVEASSVAPTESALFVKDFIIDEIRTDRLYAVAENLLPGISISDDYIWSKILAAESEISHDLRVKLRPTMFFPKTPTQTEIDDLGGMPWEEDAPYDYDPGMFLDNKWGFIVVRNSPLISVVSLYYSYPSPDLFNYSIPINWLRMDKKFGQIRIIPSSTASLGIPGMFLMQMVNSGRMIPHVMRLQYVAGLENAARDYPELLDAVKKTAVLKIIEDGFLPSSGSISADGLSESMSIDMGKYHESIDRILNGSPGSNGGLMTAIHGIRLGVM